MHHSTPNLFANTITDHLPLITEEQWRNRDDLIIELAQTDCIIDLEKWRDNLSPNQYRSTWARRVFVIVMSAIIVRKTGFIPQGVPL